MVVILSIATGFLIFKIYKPVLIEKPVIPDTTIQLAKATTIIRPSFATIQEIDNFLKGTKLSGLGWAFKQAEETSGVGADFMIALSGQESGFGSANDWSNPPYNNPLSWDITERGAGPYGYFDSKADCIIKVSGYLKKLYLTPGAAYYKGETPQSVAIYYCGGDDISWYSGILSFMQKFQKTLSETQRAKVWGMETGIIKGNLPAPLFFTKDYWTPMREDLAVYLYRINGR